MKFHSSISADRRTLLRMLAGSFAALPAFTGSPQAAVSEPFSSNRLRITRQGTPGPEGRDIVLIPGLASGPSIWQGLVQRLSGHRFHLVHIAGFDRLPAGANASGPLLTPVTGDLARYLRSRTLHAPVIIGHSMGGMLALLLALRGAPAPGRVMVVDMLPEGAAMLGGTAQGLGYLAEQLNGYFTGTKAGRQMLAQMVAQTPGAEGSDPHVIAQAFTELARTDLTPRLNAIGCPLEVAYAQSADPQIQTQQRRRYHQAYAGAPHAVITGIGPSGHMLMLDQPDKFAAAVKKFLR